MRHGVQLKDCLRLLIVSLTITVVSFVPGKVSAADSPESAARASGDVAQKPESPSKEQSSDSTKGSDKPVSKTSGGDFKFAWPLPSKVVVTETALKKGKTAKMRYNIILEKSKTDDDLVLRFENYEFLNLNGIDLTVPENRQRLGPALKQATALASLIPSLRIDKDGHAVDFVGMEQIVDHVVNLLPADNPQLRESMRTALKSPEMMQQVKEKTKDFWRIWVETWSNCQVGPGREQTLQVEIPVLGSSVVTPLRISNEGPAPDVPGSVKLTAQSVFEGSGAKKALGAMMSKLTAELPVQPGTKPMSPAMIKDFKRTQKFAVVTNPATLQPRQAMSEIITDLTIDDQKKTQIEKHDYQFDWSS